MSRIPKASLFTGYCCRKKSPTHAWASFWASFDLHRRSFIDNRSWWRHHLERNFSQDLQRCHKQSSCISRCQLPHQSFERAERPRNTLKIKILSQLTIYTTGGYPLFWMHKMIFCFLGKCYVTRPGASEKLHNFFCNFKPQKVFKVSNYKSSVMEPQILKKFDQVNKVSKSFFVQHWVLNIVM